MSFDKLDLSGARPTSISLQKIEVLIDPAVMVDNYADAFVDEIRRCNPRRFEQVILTKEDIREYCRYILWQRVNCIYDKCYEWRMLKNLYIPTFIQYAISLVGRVDLYDKGLVLFPVYEDVKYTDEERAKALQKALNTSGLISLFAEDVQMKKDAMPRDKYGDKDTMSCALIAGYVRSMHDVDHPVATYIAGFLGFTLQKESVFQLLYRIQYDDLDFLRAALINNRAVMSDAD